MTTGERFDTWRDAQDYAVEEMLSAKYRGWGWAHVEKSADGSWWAWIA